jgi:hypothetical protein
MNMVTTDDNQETDMATTGDNLETNMTLDLGESNYLEGLLLGEIYGLDNNTPDITVSNTGLLEYDQSHEAVNMAAGGNTPDNIDNLFSGGMTGLNRRQQFITNTSSCSTTGQPSLAPLSEKS